MLEAAITLLKKHGIKDVSALREKEETAEEKEARLKKEKEDAEKAAKEAEDKKKEEEDAKKLKDGENLNEEVHPLLRTIKSNRNSSIFG